MNTVYANNREKSTLREKSQLVVDICVNAIKRIKNAIKRIKNAIKRRKRGTNDAS